MQRCKFWVYILENPKGMFYVGHTSNLAVRVENHNRPGLSEGKFTRKNGPWKLEWSELHPTRSAAILREREIKKMKSRKWISQVRLHRAVNPEASGS